MIATELVLASTKLGMISANAGALKGEGGGVNWEEVCFSPPGIALIGFGILYWLLGGFRKRPYQ